MTNRNHRFTRDDAVEREADRLLRERDDQRTRDWATERALARRGGPHLALADDTHARRVPAQAVRDELLFLADVSGLPAAARLVMRLWADGWTQAEIGRALRLSQQRVSQRLRQAAARCLEAAPVSFRSFSRRAVYRAPRGVWGVGSQVWCRACGGLFLPRRGSRRYCSTECSLRSRRGGAAPGERAGPECPPE